MKCDTQKLKTSFKRIQFLQKNCSLYRGWSVALD